MQSDSSNKAMGSLLRMTPNIQVIIKSICEHGHDQNLGQACPQCMHEYRMSQDSTLKSYSDYFPKPDTTTQIEDCIHSHICCQTNCPCCPEEFRGRAPIFTKSLETLNSSDCNHSHDCCSSNCQCCPTLTKREKRKLIRKKKRTYRRNIRDGRRKGRKSRRNR
jgi:hypothetical protein